MPAARSLPPVLRDLVRALATAATKAGSLAVQVQYLAAHDPPDDSTTAFPHLKQRWRTQTLRATTDLKIWLAAMESALAGTNDAWVYLKRHADLRPGWTSEQQSMLAECWEELGLSTHGIPWRFTSEVWLAWHHKLNTLVRELRALTILPRTSAGPRRASGARTPAFKRPIPTAQAAAVMGMRSDGLLNKLRRAKYPVGGTARRNVAEFADILAVCDGPAQQRQFKSWANREFPED